MQSNSRHVVRKFKKSSIDADFELNVEGPRVLFWLILLCLYIMRSKEILELVYILPDIDSN